MSVLSNRTVANKGVVSSCRVACAVHIGKFLKNYLETADGAGNFLTTAAEFCRVRNLRHPGTSVQSSPTRRRVWSIHHQHHENYKALSQPFSRLSCWKSLLFHNVPSSKRNRSPPKQFYTDYCPFEAPTWGSMLVWGRTHADGHPTLWGSKLTKWS